MKYLFLTIGILIANNSFAWGGRGHHALCHAAVFLTKEKGLREFLQGKPHMMGHLCNIPDTYWRNLPAEQTKVGNPTHYIDVDHIATKVKDVGLDLGELTKKWTGQESILIKGKKFENFPAEFGSLWWRADQFFRRAVTSEVDWKKATPPANHKEASDEDFLYNKFAYEFVVNLGLMGHFVGDASMPFHGSADYDGYEKGHGGIHSYYEDAGVAEIAPDLEARIVKEGHKIQAKQPHYLIALSVVERMRNLTETSFGEMAKVLALDPVSKPSEKGSGDKVKKAPAERAEIATVAAKYEPMILSELARSATLLAQLWDEAYVKVGRPKLTAVKTYKYPLMPEFVAPDYLPTQK